MKLNRIIAAISAIALIMSASITTADAKKKDQPAKYIFLFIGDGMGNGHVAVTESYLSYKEGKLGGAQLTMTQFPYFGTAFSHSANSTITDSSAGGTAIACGVKTNNSAMGVDANGQPVKSMAYDLKEMGYQVGILSTVSINHATPGSFYASSLSRNNYYEISSQIAKSGFEFFAGAGFLDFRGKDNKSEAIDAYLEKNGYSVSFGMEEYEKDSKGKDKVIFCQESNREKDPGNYVTENVPAADATLGEMLELGLEFFDEDEPFFFMCEGGDIDWAGHDNKTMPMVMEMLEFDEAIEVAYEFYKKHPKETLIVVTADHETGGITLGSGAYNIGWEALEKQWKEAGNQNNLNGKDNAELNRKASIGWTTGNHTGGAVPVFAVGKGAERFSGRIDNTDIKGKILNK